MYFFSGCFAYEIWLRLRGSSPIMLLFMLKIGAHLQFNEVNCVCVCRTYPIWAQYIAVGWNITATLPQTARGRRGTTGREQTSWICCERKIIKIYVESCLSRTVKAQLCCEIHKMVTSLFARQCLQVLPTRSGRPSLLPAPCGSYPSNPFSRIPKNKTKRCWWGELHWRLQTMSSWPPPCHYLRWSLRMARNE